MEGGSAGGGCGSFIEGAGNGVPAFMIPVRTPSLVSQGRSMKTLRTSVVLLQQWGI